jgi:hypothetical protein
MSAALPKAQWSEENEKNDWNVGYRPGRAAPMKKLNIEKDASFVRILSFNVFSRAKSPFANAYF